MHTKFWLENLEGREPGRHMRRWKGNVRADLNRNKAGRCRLDSSCSWAPVAGSGKDSNEPSGSIKVR